MFKVNFVKRLFTFYVNKTFVISFRNNIDFNSNYNKNYKCLKIQNIIFGNSMNYSALWLGIFPLFFWNKESKDTPENLLGRAVIAINGNDFDEAISLLNRTLTILQTQFENEEITLIEYEGKKARIYSELANVYMLLRDLNKAAEIIIETMKSCFKAEMHPSHPTIIELSLKLALIYVEQKNYSDANIGFRFCVENCLTEINKKNGDEEESKNLEALLGMIYNYYSKFLYESSKFNHALSTVTMALEQALKVYEKTHPNVINLINDQAVIHMSLKNYDLARDKFQEAIDTCLACPKDDVIEMLPSIYVNLGLLFIEIGNADKAEEMCANSRRYLKDISDKNATKQTLKVRINDCFMRLAGLKSADRED